MKRTTSLQTLFDDLPASLLAEHPIEAETVSEETIERVLQKAEKRRRTPMASLKKRVSFILVAAVLMVCTVVSAVALTAHIWMAAYPPPAVSVADGDLQLPIVKDYNNSVFVGQKTEKDNLRVTVNSFAYDTTQEVIRLSVSVETVDGSPLREQTAERLSEDTEFWNMTLYRDGIPCKLVRNGTDAYYSGAAYEWNDTADLNKMSLEILYRPMGADKDLLGEHCVLEMEDLTDRVRVTEGLGFVYESMASLYHSMQSANEDDFRQVSANVNDDMDTTCRYTLPDSGQRIPFSALWTDAYIDNIGFRSDEVTGLKALYISFVGLSENHYPVLIDTRNGNIYRACLRFSVPPHVDADSMTQAEQAAYCGLLEENGRVTLCYEVTEDMLPYLFMMQRDYYETVIRAEGVWSVPFSVGQEDAMPTYVYTIDKELACPGYRMHATVAVLTDSGMYIEGTYEETAVPDGQVGFASIYSGPDLFIMADGTVVSELLYQHGIGKLENGTFRYGGEFVQFVDAEYIVAVKLFDDIIELKSH